MPSPTPPSLCLWVRCRAVLHGESRSARSGMSAYLAVLVETYIFSTWSLTNYQGLDLIKVYYNTRDFCKIIWQITTKYESRNCLINDDCSRLNFLVQNSFNWNKLIIFLGRLCYVERINVSTFFDNYIKFSGHLEALKWNMFSLLQFLCMLHALENA